jgi:hypothetical protein
MSFSSWTRWWVVQFNNEAPKAILRKVKGSEGGRSVRLDLNIFHAEEQ